MDENTKRMMEQLKGNPAALRQLMQSRDGQTLMQALTRPDNGAGLQRAMQAAMRGDTNVMAELVGLQLLHHPFGVFIHGCVLPCSQSQTSI